MRLEGVQFNPVLIFFLQNMMSCPVRLLIIILFLHNLFYQTPLEKDNIHNLHHYLHLQSLSSTFITLIIIFIIIFFIVGFFLEKDEDS